MSFIKDATSFIKNPLGLIGLFISFIYSFGTLFFTLSERKFTDYQVWAFLLFLILFPILILFVFYRLVTKHHHKLYAPSDYKDERNFFRERYDPKSIKDRDDKLEKEVNEIIANESESASGEQVTNFMEIQKEKFKEVKTDYILYEELALKRLEFDYKAKIERNPDIHLRGTTILVDGLIYAGDNLIPVEIKYLRSTYISVFTLESIKNILIQIKYMGEELGQIFGKKIFLLIVFVLAGQENKDRQKVIEQRIIKEFPLNEFNYKLKFYSSEYLDKEFGVSGRFQN